MAFFQGIIYQKNKGRIYVLYLDEHKDTGTHWIALFYKKKVKFFYFDSFGVEHIPEEMKRFIGNRNIKANMFRVQAANSGMYWIY